MNKFYALMLLFALATLSGPAVPAQTKGDWNAVKGSIDQEIAFETKSGQKFFGILRAADDARIEVQIADRKNLAAAATAYRRDEIVRVFRARLRFGGRRTGKGALYGAGAGAAVGTAVYLGGRSRDDDGLAGAAIPLGIVYGAGAGAVIGFFSRQKHRTKELIYSN